MNYVCPICNFDELDHPPADWHICPSCGTEFEHDDINTAYEQLRQEWIDAGAPWFSEARLPPEGWDPWRQLLRDHVGPQTASDDDSVWLLKGKKQPTREINAGFDGGTSTAEVRPRV